MRLSLAPCWSSPLSDTGWLVLDRPHPIAESRFHIPPTRFIDARLIGGPALFGVGWGMAGFCPGGALPVLGTARMDVILFIVAVIAGILSTQSITRLLQKKPRAGLTARQQS